MAIKITLKNSVVQDSVPTTSHLAAVGELALNANINSLGIYMRASDNSIVKMAGPGSVTTPAASTTVAGIAELATSGETTTGTDTARVCTPAGVKAVTDAERTTSNNTYLAKAGGTLTGVVAATAGSNSAPAIHFGDSDSGIFGGTNTVSLAAGGTTRLTADTGVSVVGTLAVTGAITSTSDLTIADKIIHAGDTNTAIRFPAADTVSVETSGSEALRVDSSRRVLVGHSSSRAISGSTARIVQVESTDAASGLSITRNSNNTNAAYISLGKTRGAAVGGTTTVQDNDALGLIQFAGADGTDVQSVGAEIKAIVDGTVAGNRMPGSLVFGTTADSAGSVSPTTRLTITSAGLVNVPDLGKFSVGSSNDALLWHDGTHTYFQNSTGNIVLQAKSGEDSIVATPDASVSLYYDTSKKFETTSDGATLTGRLSPAATDSYGLGSASLRWANLFLSGDLDMDDSDKIKLGTGDDLEIYHNGSQTYLDNTGTLNLRSTGSIELLKNGGDEPLAKFIPDGAVSLYYDNSKKLETTSDGIKLSGNGYLDLPDNGRLRLGDGYDFYLKAGTDSFNYIVSTNSQKLAIQAKDGENAIIVVPDAEVQLYYDNGKRFETLSNGVRILGAEGGNASLQFHADEGDDDGDKWQMYASDQGGFLAIKNYASGSWETSIECNNNGNVELYYDNSKKVETTAHGIRVYGAEGNDGVIQIYADEGDDNADLWKINAAAAGGFFLENYTSGAWETNIKAVGNGAVELYYDNAKKFETSTAGVVITGVTASNPTTTIYHSNADVIGEAIRFGRTDLPTIRYHSIKAEHSGGASSNMMQFHIHNASDTTSQTEVLELTGDGRVHVNDNIKFECGTGGDLQLWHDGTHNNIKSINGELHIKDTDDAYWIRNEVNGSVSLYYDNTKRLETISTGAQVTGDFIIQAGELNLMGDSDATKYLDARVGTNAFHIRKTTGGDAGHENMAAFRGDAGCEFYFDDSKKVETYSSGIKLNGTSNVWIQDDGKLVCGGGSDLEIYHDGSNSYISEEGTGHLILQSNGAGVYIRGVAGEESIVATSNGAVSLYYDNSKKLETYSGGAKVTGYLHAYEDESDSDHGISATKHVIQQSTGNQAACVVEHTANTNPYGLYIDFSDAAPDNSTKWFLSCDDSSANRLKILSSGDITTSDGGTLNSDETLKENIVDATSKLEDIKKLKVRNFNWKSSYHPEESKRKHIGFIAQEVEQVFPGLVQEYDIAPGDTKDDHIPVMKKGIKQAWAPILVKALQEAITKIETLETKVAALEGA